MMDERELSQSELARRVGVTQTTIRKLLSGGYGSKHLHRIARELQTSPAYLTGETDDPDIDAPAPPSSVSRLQSFMLPVTLPSEDALAEAFEGLLLASEDMRGAELARELAKRLPLLLRVAGGAIAVPQSGLDAAVVEAEEPQTGALHERRRA